MAKIYSVYETKAKLSELLRTVKAGKEIVVSERGTPIAKIIPFQQDSMESKILQLKESGQIIQRKKSGFKLDETIENKGALKRFLEERE